MTKRIPRSRGWCFSSFVILVDGDPFRHVGDLRRVRTVVKNGVVYDSSELYRALGVAPLVR